MQNYLGQAQSKNQKSLIWDFLLKCPYINDRYWMVISSPFEILVWDRILMEWSTGDILYRIIILRRSLFFWPFYQRILMKILYDSKIDIPILRRPQNFVKSPPHFWLALHRTKVRWRFRKILWPSQNIWTLLQILLQPIVARFSSRSPPLRNSLNCIMTGLSCSALAVSMRPG